MSKITQKKKKAIVKPVTKLTKIWFDDESYTTEKEYDSSLEYYSDTIHNILGFKIIYEQGYHYHIDVPYVPEKDLSYFLLYVLYSDGDSLGQNDGCIEYVNLYKTYEEALENKKRITEYRESKPPINKTGTKRNKTKKKNQWGNYPLYLISSTGNEYEYFPPWLGFFAHLESVEIKEVKLI